MGDRVFERVAGLSAPVVAGLSLLYAVGYLFIAPAEQRKSDVTPSTARTSPIPAASGSPPPACCCLA